MTSAVLAQSMPSAISVMSDLLGPQSVDPSSVITFPKGLLGFPECRSFILLPSEREHVYWLQSVEYSTLVFLTVDPFVFFPGYTLDLAVTDFGMPVSASEVSVLAIVTLPQARNESPTANLQGPVVVHLGTVMGHQLVVPDGPHGVREPFKL
ncbi:MAG TPA: flagellar assembly protein FliW [Candidatus Elarobacter sp.]|nr:flagellar assembly protein FliW [Candidatus Elarobacter sp.]